MLNRCEVIGTRFPDIEDCVGKQCKGIPRSDSAFTGICTAILVGYYVHTAAKLDIKLCTKGTTHVHRSLLHPIGSFEARCVCPGLRVAYLFA